MGWQGTTNQRSLQELWDMGHLIYFSLLPIYLVSFKIINVLHPRRKILFLFSCTVILGLLIEFTQMLSNRFPDPGDFFRNLLGTCFAVLFILPDKNTIPPVILKVSQIIVLFLILLQLQPTVFALVDEFSAQRSFPVLSDFETSYQVTRWSGNSSQNIIADPHQQDNQVLEIILTTDTYSGANLHYFPGNWENYTSLHFRVFNTASEKIELHCRVHDKQHSGTEGYPYQDRFNTVFPLHPGWNHYRVNLKDIEQAPDSRRMNMSQIVGAGFFVVRQQTPLTIYLDNVRLEK